MSCKSCANSSSRCNDGSKLRGEFAAASVPGRSDAERVDQLIGAHRGEAEIRSHSAGIGRYPVDLPKRQTGLLERFTDSVNCQEQRMPRQLDANLGLTDSRDVGFAGCHHGIFSNRGKYTSPCCSNFTRTRSPMSTSSTGQPTMFVVRNTPGAPSIATRAMTKGTSSAGCHF